MIAALSLTPAVRAEESAWAYTASAYFYFLSDDDDYLQPGLAADRGALHLEARYNYEDRGTGSIWIGYNLSVGETVTFDFTPMIGGVIGATDGIAPGCHASLGWRWLEWYTEAEYVFDAGSRDDSFFYAWSELTASPVEWFRVGLVGQRTRVYRSSRDVQRGLLLGFQVRNAEFAVHVFQPDAGERQFVVSVGVDF